MKNLKIVVLSLTLALVCGTASAKGCLKGAAIGGLVGHVAGRHGLLGAVGGCLVNTKMEKDKAQKAKASAKAVPAPVT